MTAAPTTPIPAVSPKPSPDIAQEAMRQRDIYTAQANRPTSELLKEIQAEREAMGVGDNKAREELRSQQMAERANMKDEQERQRHMRLAEFFASWGSTPGPVLVAGMNALKQSIPGIVSDQKEAKKARREADKIIYDIDEATRLEKLGIIAKEAKDTLEYTTAKRMLSTTKIKPKDREKADATVKAYETGWATRRQAAKDDQDLAKEQLREINERLGYGKKKPDNAGGGGAAADRPSIESFQRP
jgi:hypothetical protein